MSAILACVACQENTDDNRTLEYDSLQVNFSASLSDDNEWSDGAAIGVVANCTRGGQQDFRMSGNPVAKYKVVSAGASSNLVPETDADKVVADAEDHNWQFYGIYPYPGKDVELSDIPVSVPAVQDYSAGVMSYLTFVSHTSAVTVIPTIDLGMTTMFSLLELNLPNDLREDEESTLTSLEIFKTEGSSLSTALAPSGTYDAVAGTFNEIASESSDKITVNFGDGLYLKDAFTKVTLVVAPFTVPEGGLSAAFYDKDGSVTKVSILSAEKDAGTVLNAGEGLSVYVGSTSDGIMPVTFPVVFPVGYPNGDNTQTGYGHKDNSWLADWVGDSAYGSSTAAAWSGQHGTVYCPEQTQAYMTWTWDEAINATGITHYLETVTSAGALVSTFGVKGVWTGDYFEFTIPVKKFAAESQLQLTMPFYTRSGPTFWEVLYQDGEEWVSTAKENLPAFSGSDVTRTATWALPYGGAVKNTNTLDTDQKVTMTFKNAIKSGYVHIRVKCVDGTIISTGATAVKTVTAPYASSGKGAAPFYFWNPANAADQSIKIELL